MDNDITLEMHKLVVPEEEIESEATASVSEYLIRRAAFHGNRLGRDHKLVRDFHVVKDPLSGCWVMSFMCERWF